MVLPLIAKAGMFLATKAPVTTALSVGIPVASTLANQGNRLDEIVMQGESGPNNYHNINFMDRIFGINEDKVDAAKVAYLQRTLGPEAAKYGMTPGENGNYFTDTDTLAGARVKTDTAGEDYKIEKARETAIQLDQDRYDSPTARRERMRQDQARNDALIAAAESKLEAEKIRQEGRAEQRELLAQQGIQASEDRKLTLQLEGMRDKRAFEERRGNAQMAMVAALAGSLGDLGSAFASI